MACGYVSAGRGGSNQGNFGEIDCVRRLAEVEGWERGRGLCDGMVASCQYTRQEKASDRPW